MSTEKNTRVPVETMTARQAIELGRLVEEHKAEVVVFGEYFVGGPMTFTFLRGPDDADDVRWVIDITGDSWLADRAMRKAA